MEKNELRVAIQEMDTYQFGLKNELHNKLTKVTSYVPKKEVIDLINQLEESEITEEQAWDKIAETYPADVRSLVTSFQHFYYGDFIKNSTISKKESVVVPQFVADWLAKRKISKDPMTL